MAKLNPIKTFDYDDVRLLPRECAIQSRSEVDVTTVFGDKEFKLPVVPANMSTIMDEDLSIKLAEAGYFYVMHRFDNNPLDLVKRYREHGVFSSISVGATNRDYQDIELLKQVGLAPDYITIDIAHGHNKNVMNMVAHIKTIFPKTFVIAGNVGSVSGGIALSEAGADAVKVGIGPGSVCTTAPNTGFGTNGWQLSAVEQISDSVDSLVIADGGIRHYGDIAKSIAFGADMVMVGGMFAGHDENPGTLVIDNGEPFKEFFGSASAYQKGENRYVEGRRTLVPYKGSIDDTLKNITENLQSSVSYAGGTVLHDLTQSEYVLLN